MTVRLTILGSAGTHTGAERMCSSYMAEAGDYRLLLDCGNGSLSNLQRRWDVADIDAVIISHLHPDHFADLYGLYYALRFHPDGPRSVPVYGPRGASEFIAQLLDSADEFARTCRFTTARAGDRLALGPFDVTLFAAAHPIETLASRLRVDDAVLAYSADSAPTVELEEAARDADLFLADATWLERQRPLPAGVHMTGHEAGVAAATANVGHLVTTHVFPVLDPAEVAAEAAAAFGGKVTAAADRAEFVL